MLSPSMQQAHSNEILAHYSLIVLLAALVCGYVCYVLGKWLLKKWREFFSQFYFLKLQTKRGLGRTQGATFQVDFLDQDLLWWWKVHIKIFLMRGQIVFLIYKELVIELLKHDFFFCWITVLTPQWPISKEGMILTFFLGYQTTLML